MAKEKIGPTPLTRRDEAMKTAGLGIATEAYPNTPPAGQQDGTAIGPFIERYDDDESDLIALRHVVRVCHVPSEDRLDRLVRLVLVDGTSYVVGRTDWEIAIARAFQAAFLAEPGTYYVMYKPDEPDETFKMVVIGWAVGVDGKVHPITADWNEDVDSNNTILHPNGTVEDFNSGQTFDSLAEWLDAEREGSNNG